MTDMHNKIDQATADDKRDELRRLLAERAAASEEVFPLSYGQQALWYLQQTAPHSVAYSVPFVARVQTGLDLDALRDALTEVIRRHAATRTTFGVRNGNVVQIVRADGELAFRWFDASGWSDEALRKSLQEEVYTPFDLEQGPLFRAAAFRCDDDEHVLAFSAHHIIGDFWSLVVLLADLRQAYMAKRLGQPLKFEPPEMEYSDFVTIQRDLIESPRGEQLWEYWKKELSGELLPLNLPTDRPRLPNQSLRGAQKTFELDETLSASIRRLAQAENVTLFMTLLAAYQVLLCRCSGQQETLVGSPAVARPGGFDDVVGYFTNMVVLRANLAEDPPFSTLLQQVRKTVSGALDHQDFPFGLLVERLQRPREAGRTPLFQACFVMEKSHRNALRGAASMMKGMTDAKFELAGAEMTPLPVQPPEVPFELSLMIEDSGERLVGCFDYCSKLFDESTIERFVERYRTLLQSIAARSSQRVSELKVLPPGERQRLLDWNDTSKHVADDLCLHELVDAQVERDSEAVAVQFEDDCVTYGELDERARRLANYLQSLGIGPDALVAVYMERSVEMVVALLGTLKAGGAYVPIAPSDPHKRVAFVLEDTAATVLLTQKRLAPRLPPTGARVVCLDDAAEEIAAAPSAPRPRLTPNNLAYVIYTSGSTGRPKGVMIEHAGICNRLLWMQQAFQLTPADRVLQKTPYTFDVSVWEFFWPLIAGAGLVVARPGGHQHAKYIVECIRGYGVTTLHFVPSMLELFVEEPELEQCTTLRRVIASGEALSFGLVERFFQRTPDVELHNLYGPTEASIDVTASKCRPDDPRRIVPIGRPISNMRCYVLDPALRPVPIGVSGELHLAGVGLARGYLNQPELTAEQFVANPLIAPDELHGAGTQATFDRLYKTGDLCRWLPDGNLDFLGRIDFQVKVGGNRVELSEIEHALAEHKQVRQAVVTVQQDGASDARLAAYVVPMMANQAPVPDVLRRHLGRRIPPYMIPATYTVLESFPLTPAGKVDRRQLPAPVKQRPLLAARYVAPATPIEKQMCKIWQEVLQVDKVGVHDDFFELGGGSLTVVRAMQLAEAAGLNIDFDRIDPELMKEELFGPQVMFEYSTIAKLVPLLKESPVPAVG